VKVDTPILELRNIGKTYGATHALGPVNIEVQQGELLTLLGPSGCGKTTTLHIIAGLTAPSQGAVVMKGADITALPPPKRDMGLVFQNYALFPHKTVGENVAFGLRMRRVPRPEINKSVTDILDLVGLPGVEDRFPRQLSGGQRQRVALARAVVVQPTMLLLDEPLSNLDAVLRKRMRLEVRDIQQKLGISTVFVTHDQDEAFEMSDRIILMNGGHIEQFGTPEDLYDRPESRFAAEFIGETNLLAGKVAAITANDISVEITGGARFTTLPPPHDHGVGDSLHLMVRPERVEVVPVGEAAPNALTATIEKRVFSGDVITLGLRTAHDHVIIARKPSSARYRGLEQDMTVQVVFEDCRALPIGGDS